MPGLIGRTDVEGPRVFVFLYPRGVRWMLILAGLCLACEAELRTSTGLRVADDGVADTDFVPGDDGLGTRDVSCRLADGGGDRATNDAVVPADASRGSDGALDLDATTAADGDVGPGVDGALDEDVEADGPRLAPDARCPAAD